MRFTHILNTEMSLPNLEGFSGNWKPRTPVMCSLLRSWSGEAKTIENHLPWTQDGGKHRKDKDPADGDRVGRMFGKWRHWFCRCSRAGRSHAFTVRSTIWNVFGKICIALYHIVTLRGFVSQTSQRCQRWLTRILQERHSRRRPWGMVVFSMVGATTLRVQPPVGGCT